jgi:hypothetical protein
MQGQRDLIGGLRLYSGLFEKPCALNRTGLFFIMNSHRTVASV